MEKKRISSPSWSRAILFFCFVILFAPIVFLFFSSFAIKSNSGSYAFTFQWYQLVYQDRVMGESLLRSLFLGVTSALGATLLGTSGAIAIYKSDFIGKNFLQALSVIALVVPELVFALSMLAWFFLLQIELSFLTVLIAHITFSISIVIFTISGRLATFDPIIEEAAKDLGANDKIIILKIILPLLRPALVTSFILSFLMSFDDFLITYFLNGVGNDTLPVKLYTAMKLGSSPKLSALSVIVMSIGLLAFFLSRKLENFKGLGSKTRNQA